MPALTVVTLQNVTKENLHSIFDLKVAPEQRKFISSNVKSIGGMGNNGLSKSGTGKSRIWWVGRQNGLPASERSSHQPSY
jgi:hypothetical protein